MRFNILLGILASGVLNLAIADEWNNSYLVDSHGNPVVTQDYECVKTPQSPNTMWPDKCYNQKKAGGNVNIMNVNLAGDILFAFNKAVLHPQAGDILKSLVAQINIYSLRNIEVVGHTDNVGSEIYNQKLSSKRAANVANYLVGLGIPANKIYYRGEGESNPIMLNTTKMGQAKNRRVAIIIK